MSSAQPEPCPHCGKPMGVRTLRKLAPRIPEHFGPHRTAALEESQDGWCAICDMPIPSPRNGKRVGKYTCGKAACRKAWGNLCAQDWHLKKAAEAKGAA